MKQHETQAVETAIAASLEASLNPAPRADASLVRIANGDPPPDAHDAHGYDPSLYDWVPVLRKPREDGFTPQRQRDFIAALADSGCVAEAARAAHMTRTSCYRMRRESPQFAAAWDAAIAHAAPLLVDLAFDRAINGSDEPVFDKAGFCVGRRMKTNDRLLMFLLRAYMPDRFRHAHQNTRPADEPPPPMIAPIAEALRLLEPVQPEAPHRLLPPDELDTALLCAEIADGELPHWHRGHGDAKVRPCAGIGPELERMLEDAKRANSEAPPSAGDGYGEAGDDAFLV